MWFGRPKDQDFVLYAKKILHSFDFIGEVRFKCSTQCVYIGQPLTLGLE